MTHWHMVYWPLHTMPRMVDVHRDGVAVLEWATFNVAHQYVLDHAADGDTYQEEAGPVQRIGAVKNGRLALGGPVEE